MRLKCFSLYERFSSSRTICNVQFGAKILFDWGWLGNFLIISEIKTQFSCAVFGGNLEWREISPLCNALFRWLTFVTTIRLDKNVLPTWGFDFALETRSLLRTKWKMFLKCFYRYGWMVLNSIQIDLGGASGMDAIPSNLVGLLGLETGWWLTG